MHSTPNDTIACCTPQCAGRVSTQEVLVDTRSLPGFQTAGLSIRSRNSAC